MSAYYIVPLACGEDKDSLIGDREHPTFVKTFPIRRLEMKIREMESKLELELTTRGRLDTQIARSG